MWFSLNLSHALRSIQDPFFLFQSLNKSVQLSTPTPAMHPRRSHLMLSTRWPWFVWGSPRSFSSFCSRDAHLANKTCLGIVPKVLGCVSLLLREIFEKEVFFFLFYSLLNFNSWNLATCLWLKPAQVEGGTGESQRNATIERHLGAHCCFYKIMNLCVV